MAEDKKAVKQPKVKDSETSKPVKAKKVKKVDEVNESKKVSVETKTETTVTETEKPAKSKAQKRNARRKKPRTSTVEEVKNQIKNKTILSGRVKIVSRDAGTAEPFAEVLYNGWKYRIMLSDMDSELTIPSLINFVERTVQFIPLEILGDNVVKASRAEAQKLTKKKTVKDIESGQKLKGQVVNVLPHGAYIDVNGVTGLLKNVDFALDTTSVRDVLKIGDEINVKFKKYTSNGTILFQADKKFCNPTALKIDDIYEDSIVSGVVRAVQPFGVFVQVVVGLDALCSNNGMQELEEDEKVSVRITMVDKANKKIRGEILPRN